MKINAQSKRVSDDIFTSYQNKESLALDKTHILVLYNQFEGEDFISRSQARELPKVWISSVTLF